jgi:branched-chain amino acid transport system permease protein
MSSARAPYTKWLAGSAALCLVLLLIGLLVPILGSRADERVATGFFINLIIVLGLQIFMGNSGIMNFGFVAFMGIGAYVSAILVTPVIVKMETIPDAPFGLADFDVSFWLGALIAVVLSAMFALITGLAINRQDGIPAAIAALSVLIIVHVTLKHWLDLTRGPRAFYRIPIETSLNLVMVVSLIVVLLARAFKESGTGLQLRASRDDPVAASTMGVDVRRVRVISWVLSGAIISVGGVLTAHLLGTINPDVFYFHVTFLILAMLLLGGQSTVFGPILGATLITIGLELTRSLAEGPVVLGLNLPRMFGLPQFFLGVVIVLVMKFRPDGIVGDSEVDDIGIELRAWLQGRKRGTRRQNSQTQNV